MSELLRYIVPECKIHVCIHGAQFEVSETRQTETARETASNREKAIKSDCHCAGSRNASQVISNKMYDTALLPGSVRVTELP